MWKGLALDKEGRGEQATECYRKAVAINADSVSILWTKLRVDLDINGNYTEAAPVLDAILTINASDALALTPMGGVLAGLGRAEEGLAYYDKALEIKPGMQTYCVTKALRLKNCADLAMFWNVLKEQLHWSLIILLR